MYKFRTICLLGLKVAIPLLVFQLVFLAPLPDAFGLNQDFASLKDLNHINKIKLCCISGINDSEVIIPLTFNQANLESCRIVYLGDNKRWMRGKNPAPSDGSDDPPAFPILEDLAPQETPRDILFLYAKTLSRSCDTNSRQITIPLKEKAPLDHKNLHDRGWSIILSNIRGSQILERSRFFFETRKDNHALASF
jgi:hypothetical protein